MTFLEGESGARRSHDRTSQDPSGYKLEGGRIVERNLVIDPEAIKNVALFCGGPIGIFTFLTLLHRSDQNDKRPEGEKLGLNLPDPPMPTESTDLG